jgi:hypothetical protein
MTDGLVSECGVDCESDVSGPVFQIRRSSLKTVVGAVVTGMLRQRNHQTGAS